MLSWPKEIHDVVLFVAIYQKNNNNNERKVQRGERREGKDGIKHKNKAIILGREKTPKRATSFT